MAVLYKANETDFNHLGLGPLNDAVSILVTEERNGMFELEMRYPVSGNRFAELKADRIIKADAGHNLKNQRFKIIRITKPIDGIVTVNAEHVSYLTQDLALKPTVNYSGNASQALATWKNNIVDSNPFIVSSDITTTGSGSWSITDVKNAREALGGVRGSLLETYGGEYRFDNYSIRLMAQRGVNSGALIAYGRNLTDFTQEESIAETYTSVYPYSVYQDKNNKEVLLTLPEYFVDSEYVNNYARRKILPVDFSDEEIKDVTTLRNRAKSYVKANGIGIPKVNMKIKYIDLAKTLDYKDLAVLEEVNLCDNVSIYFEQLGVNTSAKIIKTVWDDLLEQYDSIEVGEAKSSLSKAINSTVDGKLETIVQRVNTIQLTADGLNVIHRGPEEPPAGNVGDLWYEPDGIYENMYQWDGIIWKKMLSTRDLGVLKQEVESVIAQAETDRTEAVQKINQALIDSKVYADEVTTVSALRTKVLASDVITADMIQSNVSVVDKLFATDANVNVLTSKTAFINSVKAIEISADKITTGILNAANAKIINMDASSVTSGIFSGLTFSNPYSASGISGTTVLKGDLTSNFSKTNGQYGTMAFSRDRIFSSLYSSSGNLVTGYNLSSEALNFTSAFGSAAYNFDNISITRADGASSTITWAYSTYPMQIYSTSHTELGISINGVRSSRIEYGGAGQHAFVKTFGELNVGGFPITNLSDLVWDASTSIKRGVNSLDVRAKAIYSVSLSGFAAMYLTRDTIAGTQTLDLYAKLNMQGNVITNQSDRRLKTDIHNTVEDSLSAISRWNFVDYKWMDSRKPRGVHLGLIAQDTPELSDYDAQNDVWNINSSKQTMMNSHAIQQVANIVNINHKNIETRVDVLSADVININNQLSKRDSEFQELKDRVFEVEQENKELKNKIQQMESVS